MAQLEALIYPTRSARSRNSSFSPQPTKHKRASSIKLTKSASPGKNNALKQNAPH